MKDARRFKWYILPCMVLGALFLFSMKAYATDAGQMATVYKLWVNYVAGEEGEMEPDLDTLVISDEKPEGMELFAKYVTDGSYAFEDGDESIFMFLNNATTSFSYHYGYDLPNCWEMSGDSMVTIAGSIDITSATDRFLPYANGIENGKALLDYYTTYPYRDDQGQNLKRKRYDYHIYSYGVSWYKSNIVARKLEIDEGIMASLEYSTLRAEQIVLNGRLLVNTNKETPVISVLENGSMSIGENSNFVGPTSFEAGATCTGTTLYKWTEEYEVVPYEFPVDHDTVVFRWYNKQYKWICGEPPKNLFQVHCTPQYWYDEQERQYVKKGYVQVGDQILQDDQWIDFTVGEPITFQLIPPPDREGCYPYFVIIIGEPDYYKNISNFDGASSSPIYIPEDPNGGPYQYTFTPKSDTRFYFNVLWSKYETFSGWIETKTIGNLSEVSFDREPNVNYGVPREPNPNNDPNKGFGRKYWIEGTPVTLTFTPKEGYSIARVGVRFGEKYRNFVTAIPEREGEESIYAADSGFTDNGDGSFSYTVNRTDCTFEVECKEDPIGEEPPKNKFKVHCTPQYWFDEQERQYVKKGYVQVGDQILQDDEWIDFTVGEPITFQMIPPPDREGCYPYFVLVIGEPNYHTNISNFGGAATHQATLSMNSDGMYEYTYTPESDTRFYFNVLWSNYETLSGYIETKTIGNLSEVSFDREPNYSAGGFPVEPNPNNDPNKGFGRKYWIEGTPVTLTFTPKEGYSIARIGVRLGGTEKYRNFVTATPEREGEESIYVADSGFVDNGDGSFSFTVTEKGYPDWCFDIECVEKPVPIKITKKSLTLYDTIAIDFKVLKADLEGYHDPYLLVMQNGAASRISDYKEDEDLLIFTYRVAPHKMGDVVKVVPHALNANNEDKAGETFTYSVADYCYNMLNKEAYQEEKYAPFRRLLVDILLYGDAAQVYTNYKTDELVSKNLSDVQRTMGTDLTTAMMYQTVKEKFFATVDEEDELASVVTAALYLEAAVNIQFKFLASNLEGLRVVVTGDMAGTEVLGEYEATENQIDDKGRYYVNFGELNAGQMRKTVYATVMKGDKKVSNTYRYSVESYAASMRTDGTTKLDKLLDAMMRYGDSAAAYVNN